MEKTELTAEEVQAMFFDKDALFEAPKKIYRLDYRNDRYYYILENGDVEFYISITNLIQKQLPTSPHLIKWIAERGIENADSYKDERAEYGTFLHIQCAELLIAGKYNLDLLGYSWEKYLVEKNLPLQWIKKYSNELSKDVLSFAQFCKDYDVKPMAVEIALVSKHGFACTTDIICEMNDKLYTEKTKQSDRKRITSVVDIKSGKKGFYEAHVIQLHACKIAVEENFKKIKIDRVFNWSPSDWKDEPTYKLKDQTDNKSKNKLSHILRLQDIDSQDSENRAIIIEGTIDLQKELTSNYSNKTYKEIILSKISNHESKNPKRKPGSKKQAPNTRKNKSRTKTRGEKLS